MLDLDPVFERFPELDTARCRLRQVTPEDAPDILRLRSDVRVTRFLGHPPMTSLEEALRRVDLLRATFEGQVGIPWGVASRDDGRIIGTCSLFHLAPEHRRAEVGYELGVDWWGRGIMTEVVGAVLDYGFTVMGLHSVEARMDPENAASRALAERLGFTQEGYLRESYFDPTQERFTDTALFSLLKATWSDRAR